jgi:benzoate-CoA ligase
VGATTILMAERPTPQAVFKRLIERRPTIFYGVPTLYAAMLAAPELPTREAVALRRCVSAGERCQRMSARKFAARFGCDVLDGIGSTEMLHIFLSNRPGEVRYGTRARRSPATTSNCAVKTGDRSPLARSATCSSAGQARRSCTGQTGRRRARRFKASGRKSGDKYVRGADGYFTYAGRSDDMLKVAGNTCRRSRSKPR